MIVIRPIPISPIDVVREAPAPLIYPLWNEFQTYAVGDMVTSSDGRIWRAPLTSVRMPGESTTYNVGQDPTLQEGFFLPYGSVVYPIVFLRPNPTQLNFWWVGVSSEGLLNAEHTEEYKMFYQPLYEQTVAANEIVVSLHPAFPLDSVALFNLDATSVTVELYGYSRTKSTSYKAGTGRRKEVSFLDLPTYSQSEPGNLKLTISNSGGTAKCGYVCVGTKGEVAMSTSGTSLSIKDYSHKERDTFGNITIIEREYSSQVGFSAYADSNSLGQIRRYLSQLRCTPAAYIAHPDLEETLVFGFYSDFMFAIEEYTDSLITLSVEGLV